MRLDAPRFQGGEAWVGVAALSLQQRQHSDVNVSRSSWRDGEIHELLTIMGEKVMRSHNALNEDVDRWCDLRERRRGTVLTRLYSG